MRVFVAGATGALGRPLVRRLVEAGYQVSGLTRTPGKRGLLEALGVRPVVADALDPAATEAAVREAGPEAVVHLLSALPAAGPLRARDLRATNALRERGTAILLRAARAAGSRRFVAASFVGVHGLGSGEVLSEEAPLGPSDARAGVGAAAAALRSLEEQVLGAPGIEGIVLRFGSLYGPGVGSTEAMVARLRRGRLRLPAGGPGTLPWIHAGDAAAATVRAIERGRPGEVYAVVDDEPATLGAFAAALAEAIGAPAPRPIPPWLAGIVAPLATAYAVRARLRVSNAKAKRELGWAPAFPTHRDGLEDVATALGA